MQDDILGWHEWEADFLHDDAVFHPSELHGLVVGLVCVVEAPSSAQWQQILRQLDCPELSEDALRRLTEEGEDAAAALADDELDYLPLLPDDQHSLKQRVEALAAWCDGVVLGFGLASGQLRADEQELIEHLQDVAAVEFTQQDDDEEGEISFNELFEFVRLIPISLSTGRQKIEVAALPLMRGGLATASSVVDGQIVNMFSPQRPS